MNLSNTRFKKEKDDRNKRIVIEMIGVSSKCNLENNQYIRILDR